MIHYDIINGKQYNYSWYRWEHNPSVNILLAKSYWKQIPFQTLWILLDPRKNSSL